MNFLLIPFLSRFSSWSWAWFRRAGLDLGVPGVVERGPAVVVGLEGISPVLKEEVDDGGVVG